MAAPDSSLQFQEPAHPSISSSHTDDSAVDPAHNGATTTSPPGMQRQSSVSKIAHVAKQLVKSPAEEKEHLKLEKTLSEAKRGEADVGTMEV